ncbi:MAG: hypothetical protein ACREQ5_02340 [Candidatus Dormibacteria bacterium]
MTAEPSHRFALTGHDPEGRNRTIIPGHRELDCQTRRPRGEQFSGILGRSDVNTMRAPPGSQLPQDADR